MQLRDQVCSLELAKKLDELGIKQQSQFYWVKTIDNPDIGIKREWGVIFIDNCDDEIISRGDIEMHSAFTVAELGRMLPFTIKMKEWQGWKFEKPRTFYLGGNLGYTDHTYAPTICYHFYMYEDDEENDPVNMICGPDFCDTNEANSRAQMLIYLLENKIIGVPE